jgi:hypothetical protein
MQWDAARCSSSRHRGRRPPRLDHERSRLVALNRDGVWQVLRGDGDAVAVLNLAFHDAQQRVGNANLVAAHVDAAKRQAEQVLRAFFAGTGWTVTVRWR